MGFEGEERFVFFFWFLIVFIYGVLDNFVDIIVFIVKFDIKVESYVIFFSWIFLYVYSEFLKYKNLNVYKNILMVYLKCSI